MDETTSISTSIGEAMDMVVDILGDVVTLVTGNIIFLIPIAASLIGIGIGVFRKLKGR